MFDRLLHQTRAMTVCMCAVVVVCSWLDPVGSLGLSLAI